MLHLRHINHYYLHKLISMIILCSQQMTLPLKLHEIEKKCCKSSKVKDFNERACQTQILESFSGRVEKI